MPETMDEKTFEEFCQSVGQIMKDNGWKLIGISGATNSGKTTAVNYLKSHFPASEVIHQDVYFREEDDPMHVWIQIQKPEPRRHQHWEHQNCIDWVGLVRNIERIVKNKPTKPEEAFLFIDGHIIYNNPQLVKLFAKKFFIDLEKDVMYGRRITRTYVPADVPGYFEEWVWPQYLENRELLANQSDIFFIDGLNTTEYINQKIVDNL